MARRTTPPNRKRLPPITAGKLRLVASERRALREAGLEPSDLAHLRAWDVVAATDEAIGDERAEELTGLASMIGCGIGSSVARAFVAAGIRNRAELATQSVDAMFIAYLDRTSYTNAVVYDVLSQAVYLAGTKDPDPSRLMLSTWARLRKQNGFDPLLMYWRHLHGEEVEIPRPTRRRLKLPTIGVNSRICEGGLDASGRLVTPLGQKDVVIHEDGPLQLVLGHWMWRGGFGAFVRLEDLQKGDGVQIGDDWFGVTAVKKVAAPFDLKGRDGEVLMATPPHLRVGTIGTAEMLKGVERTVMQVVVRAKPKKFEELETKARPLRPVRGAF